MVAIIHKIPNIMPALNQSDKKRGLNRPTFVNIRLNMDVLNWMWTVDIIIPHRWRISLYCAQYLELLHFLSKSIIRSQKAAITSIELGITIYISEYTKFSFSWIFTKHASYCILIFPSLVRRSFENFILLRSRASRYIGIIIQCSVVSYF